MTSFYIIGSVVDIFNIMGSVVDRLEQVDAAVKALGHYIVYQNSQGLDFAIARTVLDNF